MKLNQREKDSWKQALLETGHFNSDNSSKQKGQKPPIVQEKLIECPFCLKYLPKAGVLNHAENCAPDQQHKTLLHFAKYILPDMELQGDDQYQQKSQQKLRCPFCNKTSAESLLVHIHYFHPENETLDIIAKQPHISLPSYTLRALLKQTLEGIRVFQASGFIHRDIKCNNILLHSPPGSGRVYVKISDFGFAKKESLTKEENSVAGKLTQIKCIKRPLEIKDNILWNLLSYMLEFNPDKRITVVEALQHPYFTSPDAIADISKEQKKLALQAEVSQLEGDLNITEFDKDPSFVVSESVIKDYILGETHSIQ
ncbi:MAG: hypothetical protein EZS28_027697, partial [Streblomastix strix]